MTSNFSSRKRSATELLSSAVSGAILFIMRHRNFAFAFMMAMFFYLPTLKSNSVDAAFLYAGDSLGWYFPALAKAHALFHSLNFTAIDFSTFNGSSDFFLSANFFAYHPLVIIYSLLVPVETTSFQGLGHYLVLLLAFHSFLGVYFSLKLFTRFFSFEFGAAALLATVFTFSIHMIVMMVQPNYIFIASTIPWITFGALSYSEKPSLRQLVFSTLPVIFIFMGGYMPLAVACLALSVALVITKLLVIDNTDKSLERRFHAFFTALTPYACASIIVGPYLYAVYSFNKETLSTGFSSLYYSAHQMAEEPQSLLRLISSNNRYHVPGSFYEFSIAWGFIAIIVATVFFSSRKTIDALTQKEWGLFSISAVMYFATLLACYGDYSAVSDLVYYFVPQVGKMHIYQRFLLPAQLLFAVMMVLMLKAVIIVRPPVAIRSVIALFASLTLVAAYLLGRNPIFANSIGIDDYVVLELFLGFLFACSLLVPGKYFVYSVTIILVCIPVLKSMYNYTYTANQSIFEKQKEMQKIPLDGNEQARLLTYLKRFTDKETIKYVDITPMWSKQGVENFPKVFPYFVLNELHLSSYGGYTYYLSARADYMRRMPIGEGVAVNPDWGLVLKSGADFVVAREVDMQNGALSDVFARSKSDDILRLPNDVVIIPLHDAVQKTLFPEDIRFDNGVFRISAKTADARNLQNIAAGKLARQSSTFGVADARLAVDGNTNGNFDLGSVSHTGLDKNAWLDIDLGATDDIDSVRIWNRTDGAVNRLNNFWVFISETPFLATDTASVLKTRNATWGKINFTPEPMLTIKTGGIRGRYVRVQFDGTQSADQSFLSLAEVEVFRSDKPLTGGLTSQTDKPVSVSVNKFLDNHANYMQVEFDASAPTTVTYLFWDNPRLKLYLNGERTKLVERNGLWVIDASAGHNTIEIHYVHWPLRIFWWFYSLYALVFLWFVIPARARDGIWRKLFHVASPR